MNSIKSIKLQIKYLVANGADMSIQTESGIQREKIPGHMLEYIFGMKNI